MLELAMHKQAGPLALQEMASRQGISAKYLEQLLIPLKAAGLVTSMRGAKGGYLLAMTPEKISLFDIVRTLEGPLAVVECVQDPLVCERVGGCTVHLVWGEMSQLLVDFLAGISLAELAKRQTDKDAQCLAAQALLAAPPLASH
jgi:Rrf2 family protein